MKRARSASQCAQRVVIDVGGTKISTTVATIERSSYLHGMVETADWENHPEHVAEIFLDRDPEIFSRLMRLMRQQPHVAGLVPTDPIVCASLLAEADFFGYEPLLNHAKVVAYYNAREAKEDYPPHTFSAWEEGEEWAAVHARRDAEIKAKFDRQHEVDSLHVKRDEAFALSKFDEVFGSIAEALADGVLPKYFLAPRPAKLAKSERIVQIMPVDATTWFLVGSIADRKCHVDPSAAPDTYQTMAPLPQVFAQPSLVRRVAFYALCEDEKSNRWVEPMLHISASDQQHFMDDQDDGWNNHTVAGPTITLGATRAPRGLEPPSVCPPPPPPPQRNGPTDRPSRAVGDPRLLSHFHNAGQRTMRASLWIEHAVHDRYAMYCGNGMIDHVHKEQLWTHVLVAEQAPCEHPFEGPTG